MPNAIKYALIAFFESQAGYTDALIGLMSLFIISNFYIKKIIIPTMIIPIAQIFRAVNISLNSINASTGTNK